jgi:hypothetical protein
MSDLTPADFASPEAAGARLGALEGDSAWAARLMNKDAAALAEFASLTRAIAGIPHTPAPSKSLVVADLKAGEPGSVDLFAEDARSRLPEFSVVTGNEISDHRRLDLIEQMRARGTTEQMVREAFDESRVYPAEIHEMARVRWHELSGDADFRRRLLSGDAAAERQWRAYCIIAAGGVKG